MQELTSSVCHPSVDSLRSAMFLSQSAADIGTKPVNSGAIGSHQARVPESVRS
jgi:hypothetical protein